MLGALVAVSPKCPGGQRPFDPLLMFKALVPGRLHNLSHQALKRQIRKDLSFVNFLGLTLADPFPHLGTHTRINLCGDFMRKTGW